MGRHTNSRMKTPLVGTPFAIDQQEGHKYNLDSILLANFIKNVPKKIKKIYDFGTGQGVLMFYLALKTDANITGFDIQKSFIELANRNIEYNQLDHQLEALEQDIKLLTIHHADMIVSNPPYFKVTKDIPLSTIESRQIARHEVHLTLETLLEVASRSLRTKGVFYMSYRPDRLQELMMLSQKHKLIIKEIQFVHPYQTEFAHLVLIKMVKDANVGIKILEPLILYESKQIMTESLKKIYEGDAYASFNTE